MSDPLKQIFKDSSTRTKKLTLYTFLEIVAVFIMCLVGGCFDWVHLKFTFDKFGTWGFYETVLQKWVLYSGALVVGTLFKLEKEELNNRDYFFTLGLYRAYLHYKLESFASFIERIFNPKTKKLYMKQNIENKLISLDRFAKDDWRIEFNDAVDSKDIEHWNWKNKHSKKYGLRRIQLQRMLTKEYIEDNWKDTHIKYPAVSPRVFTFYLRKNISPDQDYQVTNETAKHLGKAIGRKLLRIFLLSVVLAMFVMQPQANELLEQAYGWIVMIIEYIIRVVVITFTFLVGLYTGKTVFYDNYVLPIENRIRILIEYFSWEEKINIDVQKIKLDYKVQFEKEEEEREQKEQLKKQKVKQTPTKNENKKENHKDSNVIEYEISEEEAKEKGLLPK